MTAQKMTELSRLCIHTITTKPLSIEEAAKEYLKAGVKGITVWRDALEGRSIADTGKMLRDHDLSIVSLCRGGFFAHIEPTKRNAAIEDNRKLIDEAAALGAPLIVLVCGAHPRQPLADSRSQILDGIAAVLPHARANNVKLAIEPLHPMYADDRSAINTMRQANDMVEALDSEMVGVAIDVYHTWWDPDLKTEIESCGRNKKIFAFHICDWKTPTKDILLDRGLMGEGCINIREIAGWVEEAGFQGFHEVEIFSKKYWKKNQVKMIRKITDYYSTQYKLGQ